jgi:hypothetical protein
MSSKPALSFLILLFTATGALVDSKSFAQTSPPSGSDAKSVEQSAKPLPIRLPANSNLPLNVFRTRESFMKNVPANGVIGGFEMTPYKNYVQKYAPPATVGMTDISPDRMVAVVVVNFPKGFTGPYNEFSSASMTTAYDALTGKVISYELLGTPVRSFGPSFIPDSKP